MKTTNINKSRRLACLKVSDTVCQMVPTQQLCYSDVSDQIALLADHAKSGGMLSRFEVRYAITEADRVKSRGGVQLLFVFPDAAPKRHVRVYRYLTNARRMGQIISKKHKCITVIVRVWFDEGLLDGQPAFEAAIQKVEGI